MHNSAISEPKTIADFDARLPNGERVSLADRLGKVVLVVNTASKCGFTPQYEGLETLWRHHRDAGFEILAFPCNQFGAQEPGSADEIASFCQVNFGLSFPLMAKVDVNGDKAEPLFDWLKAQAPDVKVELTVMTFNELDLALRERRVQIAIRGMYRREAGFHYQPLFIERHRLYVARHRIKEASTLPLVYRSQPFVHEALNSLGLTRGPTASGLEAVAMLVLSGHYVGLLPQYYAALFGKRHALVQVPTGPEYENAISAITEASRPRTRALELFLDLLAQCHPRE